MSKENEEIDAIRKGIEAVIYEKYGKPEFTHSDVTMSTTNDEQAPYGIKEKIGPSGLTAKRIAELIKETGLKDDPLFTDREIVRRVVESLITKGVLRVVKKAHVIGRDDDTGRGKCSNCGYEFCYENLPPVGWYCGPCGAEIVKQ